MEARFVPENLQGGFRVLDSCLSCAACWKHAPSLLKSHPRDAYAYFSKQPENEAELLLANQVINLCPVKAIVDIDKTDQPLQAPVDLKT